MSIMCQLTGCIIILQKNKEVQSMRVTHGLSNTRLHGIWGNIIQRCTNPNNQKYYCYGARGVKVCSEWLHDFQAFYDWAMSNGYADNLTIDRIDVNGNYEPSNCRWVDIKSQMNNMRKNVMIEYNGKTQTLAQWADEMNIPYKTLHKRIKDGWDIEKALTQKENPLHCAITYNGKTQTIAEWAREYNINYDKLKRRINKYHWSIEKALNTP